MKRLLNFTVLDNQPTGSDCSLLRLRPADGEPTPEIRPGQFAQVRIDTSKTTFLRRPISICDYDEEGLSLLVRRAGAGTRALADASIGQVINLLLPLGNGFTLQGQRPLLVGGGVGIAPLIGLGRAFAREGVPVHYIVGGRTGDFPLNESIDSWPGGVDIATDDGSRGFHGLVTDHPAWAKPYDVVYCCGPTPMMKAVARKVTTPCYVSLENMMACGLGACLCCVENTVRGNVCVCTEGPVFPVTDLTW